MHFIESGSTANAVVRAAISALAICLLSVSLVGCGQSLLAEAPSTESGNSTSPADPAIKPSSNPQPNPLVDSQNFKKLESFVASQQATRAQVLAQFPDMYSDFRLEAEKPGTIVFTYVYSAMMDPVATANNLEKIAAPQLQEACDTEIFPALRAAGVKDPMTARYVYVNADGSLIWQENFTPS